MKALDRNSNLRTHTNGVYMAQIKRPKTQSGVVLPVHYSIVDCRLWRVKEIYPIVNWKCARPSTIRVKMSPLLPSAFFIIRG